MLPFFHFGGILVESRNTAKKVGDTVDMDVLSTDVMYPCESATDAVLSDAIWFASQGASQFCEKLRTIVYSISEEQIPWLCVHSLSIIGNASTGCNYALKEVGLNPGIYINQSGDWLLLIHPEQSSIDVYIGNCGNQLTYLSLHNTMFSQLNLSPLTALVQLRVWNDKKMAEITGFMHLTQLTDLRLFKCHNLTSFPELKYLTQLEKLLLIDCNGFKQLPEIDNLAHITKLSLSQCRSLIELPDGIRDMKSIRYLDLSGLRL